MSVSLSEVDEQLERLGQVPEALEALVERHGGKCLSLDAADAVLASLGEVPEHSSVRPLPLERATEAAAADEAKTEQAAPTVVEDDAPTVVEEESTDTASVAPPPELPHAAPTDVPPVASTSVAPPGTFSELPPEPEAPAAPAPLVEEPLFEDEIAAADAALFDNEVEAAWASQAPPAPSQFPARAPRTRRDTLRDESSPPPPMAVEFDADLDMPGLAAPAVPAEAVASHPPELPQEVSATSQAVDDMFGDLERPVAPPSDGDGTVTAIFDSSAPAEPQRVSVSVPPPLRSGDATKTAPRADQTGDFELLFEDEIEEIDDDELELLD